MANKWRKNGEKMAKKWRKNGEHLANEVQGKSFRYICCPSVWEMHGERIAEASQTGNCQNGCSTLFMNLFLYFFLLSEEI